jgi:release factor glutamine methyltransferase
MQNFLNYINTELQGLYDPNEIQSFAFLIVENVCGMSRTEIIVNKNTIFSEVNRQIMNSFVDKLKNNMPIQYILGKSYFYNAEFKVSPSVLIPRPETEELVDWVVADMRKLDSACILDIGTGSGCIAISIKKALPNADLSAFDISEEALNIARENAKNNDVNVDFQKVDILNAEYQTAKWDCIVSNPPYIPLVEKAEILPNVLHHEPHLALFVPNNDPLLFYRKIANFAQKHLNIGGCLYFEIHRSKGAECVAMLHDMGYKNIQLKKDIFANDRMIKAEL